MIAKAATISHGSNAIRYSVNKDRADIVKTNLLPDDISPEAMFKRMMLVQKMFTNERKRGRPFTDNVIRIEISPSAEESKGWTMDDWARLADEFIQAFDSIDLSKKTKRASSKQTNLKGSQYVVALHRDAKSGILHLHIDANRVDMEGKTPVRHEGCNGCEYHQRALRLGAFRRNRHTPHPEGYTQIHGDTAQDG